jgi:PPOX class probable F420-dependent enzyme
VKCARDDGGEPHPTRSKEKNVPLDEDVIRLAEGANLATIVTLMPDGQPQAQLRWIDTDGENLLVNTEPQRQAARNLTRDPRITVLIHSDSNAWDWAEVRGRVVATTGGEEARAHIDKLSQKYMGTDYRNPIGPEGRVLFTVAPDKVVTPAGLFGRRPHDE